jgi:hypothetical protein
VQQLRQQGGNTMEKQHHLLIIDGMSIKPTDGVKVSYWDDDTEENVTVELTVSRT